jgi:thymidine kinase
MKYGILTTIAGPMYASKSTNILKRVLWARHGKNLNVKVFKPAFDNRFSETQIVSHDGLRTPADSVVDLPETVDADMIVIDEIQFFPESCVEWVRKHLALGIDVVVAGLDMDYKGIPFHNTALLYAMADEAVKLTANCVICGRPAPKTHRTCEAMEITDGPSVELGASEKYVARCNDHWSF